MRVGIGWVIMLRARNNVAHLSWSLVIMLRAISLPKAPGFGNNVAREGGGREILLRHTLILTTSATK